MTHSRSYAHTHDMFINISILKLKNIYGYNAGIFIFKYVPKWTPRNIWKYVYQKW